MRFPCKMNSYRPFSHHVVKAHLTVVQANPTLWSCNCAIFCPYRHIFLAKSASRLFTKNVCHASLHETMQFRVHVHFLKGIALGSIAFPHQWTVSHPAVVQVRPCPRHAHRVQEPPIFPPATSSFWNVNSGVLTGASLSAGGLCTGMLLASAGAVSAPRTNSAAMVWCSGRARRCPQKMRAETETNR